MVVIVTRPASSGRRLVDRITEQGHRALWWPAFDIDIAPDVEGARATISRLADYDVAIFVSANAVRAVRLLLNDAWPPATMIGAVGASTCAAIQAELRPDSKLIVTAPSDDSLPGSEAFWLAWQATGRRARRVLIVRAEDGREWLSERFVDAGAEVDAVAVYTRRLHQPSAAELQQLRDAITDDEWPAIVFSSSESVAALDRQIDSAAQAWLRTGAAIACHPRIAEQSLAHGYTRVLNATFDDDSIIATLKSIGIRT